MYILITLGLDTHSCYSFIVAVSSAAGASATARTGAKQAGTTRQITNSNNDTGAANAVVDEDVDGEEEEQNNKEANVNWWEIAVEYEAEEETEYEHDTTTFLDRRR